jgi:hypothetical protein
MKVYKPNLERYIGDDQLQEYLAAGWTQNQAAAVEAEEKISLKPPAKVKAATNAEDITIENKGE